MIKILTALSQGGTELSIMFREPSIPESLEPGVQPPDWSVPAAVPSSLTNTLSQLDWVSNIVLPAKQTHL